MSRLGRRLVRACTSTIAVGLLMTGCHATRPREGSGGSPGTEIAVGAYLHYGSPGVERMREFSRWLGGTELRAGHTYLPGDTW
ncbi:hypothetical protein ACFV9E_37610, partial [Streptomyces sp. NPDC059835]